MTAGREWHHAPETWAEIWEKSVSWVFVADGKSWDWDLGEARRICALRAPHVLWGRWKSQHRKKVYLSPYVEKPFKSKVIKSFVPELRSRKYFLCFGIPIFYVYMLWTFYVHFTYSCMATLQLKVFRSYTSLNIMNHRHFLHNFDYISNLIWKVPCVMVIIGENEHADPSSNPGRLY